MTITVRIDENFSAQWDSSEYPELNEKVVKESHLSKMSTHIFDWNINHTGMCKQEVYEKVHLGTHTFQGVGFGLKEDYEPILRGVVNIVRDK